MLGVNRFRVLQADATPILYVKLHPYKQRAEVMAGSAIRENNNNNNTVLSFFQSFNFK